MHRYLGLLALILFGVEFVPAAEPAEYSVGVATQDITPKYAVRLSGFGSRRAESEGVTQRIFAKALAIGDKEPAVLISVDNLGVPANIRAEVAKRLQKQGVSEERLAICASHTHTAPMLTNVAPTLFGMPIPSSWPTRRRSPGPRGTPAQRPIPTRPSKLTPPPWPDNRRSPGLPGRPAQLRRPAPPP